MEGRESDSGKENRDEAKEKERKEKGREKTCEPFISPGGGGKKRTCPNCVVEEQRQDGEVKHRGRNGIKGLKFRGNDEGKGESGTCDWISEGRLRKEGRRISVCILRAEGKGRIRRGSPAIQSTVQRMTKARKSNQTQTQDQRITAPASL